MPSSSTHFSHIAWFRICAPIRHANWKGLLRLSLVTCPVALYAAASHASPLIRGTSQTIEIDQFVPRSELDPVYTHHSYYLVPNGEVGHDAFAVIRETLRATNKVALARLELDNGQPIIIALEARDVGMLAMLLRRPSEVRDPGQYFEGVHDVHVTKEMLDLSQHIVEMKSGHFDPQQPEESPLKKKAPVSTESPSNVINLMDALKKSVGGTCGAQKGKARRCEPDTNRQPCPKKNPPGMRPAG